MKEGALAFGWDSSPLKALGGLSTTAELPLALPPATLIGPGRPRGLVRGKCLQ